MNNYSEALNADRRLVILKLLANSTRYTAGQPLLYSSLPNFGHDVSMDVLKSDLAWLEEQSLVSLNAPGGVTLATISQRGVDVANGKAVVPGVKRPGPED